MRVWENATAWGIDYLVLTGRADPPAPGPGQVLVGVRAASSNYRDLGVVKNTASMGQLPQIPFSDCAGEVLAVGADVMRVQVGDRVCATFFQDWISGPPTAGNRARVRGSASLAGVLQERLLVGAEELVKVPDHLTYIEAAALPCAALTAWRALVVYGRVQARQTVVVQGTGGVSIFALQFAKLHGATVILTSSSNDKLERGRALGADHLINYREVPDWGLRVRELTKGLGADVVVEVGGAGTINQSLVAARVDGQVLVIGVLGGRSQELQMPAIFNGNLHLHGVTVGSRDDFDAMLGAMTTSGMRPVVDRVVPFSEAPDALRVQASGAQFGKVCIEL